MPRNLTPLPRTNFTGLDYNNIIRDITNIIQDNSNYNQSWDDFLSSDAGRMLVELFAYIADQLATRIDWIVNENWIGTATQKISVMRILKLIGYQFTLPIASEVPVVVDLSGDTYPGEFYLTPLYDPEVGTFTPYSLNATDKKGNTRRYELITFDNTTEEYEYKLGVKISSEISTVNFYEGTTYLEEFIIENDNSETLELTNFPVIEGSIKIYFVDETVSPVTEEELTPVNTFLDTEAQSSVDEDGEDIPIPYILNIQEDESVIVEFGSTALLPSNERRPTIGDKIRVFYRTGGGIDGNLTARAINTTKTISVTPIATGVPIVIQPVFTNTSSGVNGANGETAARAATYGPLQIRTSNKAVTPDDYDILLAARQGTITAKAYGANNEPSDVFTDYGENIKPLDVWCYVVPEKSGWDTLLPSQYNDFWWMSLNLQNMFNEVLFFTKAYFNKQFYRTNDDFSGKSLGGDTIDYDGNGDTLFYNYFTFVVGDTIGDSIFGNTNFKLKMGDTEDTNKLFSNLSDLIVGDTIRTAAGDTALRVTENIQAYYTSPVNVENGINLTVKNKLKINIDNAGDTIIDLSIEAIDKTKTRAIEIVAAINKKLYTSDIYDNSGTPNYGDSNGATGVASLIEPSISESYIKLTSPKSGDSSSIKFLYEGVGDSNVTSTVFGSNVDGDTFMCRGKRSLTYVSNSTETSYFNKIIYEAGTLSIGIGDLGDTFFMHVILSSGDTKAIGTYFNENFISTDVKYRPVADRIYNNIDETVSGNPDVYLSDYEIRFTNSTTDSMSIYNITNTWDLSHSENPEVIGDTRANTGDTMLGLDSAKYLLRLNIDGQGDTTIDITGDSGQSSSYLGTDIVYEINSSLQNAYSTNGYPYQSYNYASYDKTSKHIILKSPTRDNSSYIKFIPTDGDTDAKDVLFGIENDGDSHIYYATGDYYLSYNSSEDRMDIVRLVSNNQSNVPDGNMYVHYIWDRRGDTVTTTDEDLFQAYMNNKKIIGLNNVFKQTLFSTFDITGTIYYDDTFTSAEVKNAVETALYDEFSFVNDDGDVKRDYGQNISRAKVLNLIQNIDGVNYTEISYFGKDATDSTTNEANTIQCNFDEIIVLRETSGGRGLNFTYISSAV
jgi:hypothetical protein